MATPESTRNSQLRPEILEISPIFPVMSTIPQAITSTTKVRMAVARLELTFSMPILARIDVRAANTADSMANTNHMIPTPRLIYLSPGHPEGRSWIPGRLRFTGTLERAFCRREAPYFSPRSSMIRSRSTAAYHPTRLRGREPCHFTNRPEVNSVRFKALPPAKRLYAGLPAVRVRGPSLPVREGSYFSPLNSMIRSLKTAAYSNSSIASRQAPYLSFPAAPKTRSLRCRSFSHATRFAELAREPCLKGLHSPEMKEATFPLSIR